MALLHKFFLKPVKSYNRTIRYFLLSSIAFNTAMGIFMVMYPFYIRELGYTDSLNGQIIAFQAAATAIALLPAGILGDRYGRKRMLIIGSIMLAISFAIRSVSSTEFLLLFGAGLTGFFFAFLQVSAIPLLAENSKEKQRVKLFALHAAIMMGANVLGHLFSGTLADLLYQLTAMTMLQAVQLTLILAFFLTAFSFFPLLKVKDGERVKAIKKSCRCGRSFP